MSEADSSGVPQVAEVPPADPQAPVLSYAPASRRPTLRRLLLQKLPYLPGLLSVGALALTAFVCLLCLSEGSTVGTAGVTLVTGGGAVMCLVGMLLTRGRHRMALYGLAINAVLTFLLFCLMKWASFA